MAARIWWSACGRFVEHAEGISEPGQIYSWIRTTAHRSCTAKTNVMAAKKPSRASTVWLASLLKSPVRQKS